MMGKTMNLTDRFEMPVENLRISVTQRCNLDCIYCHREGENRSGEEAGIGRICEVVGCAAKWGVKSVKITGGEPLVRRDIVEIVSRISATDGIEEVSMTTNGTLLEKLAWPLFDAGLCRVNIGCDSVSGAMDKNARGILPGIRAAKKAGLAPIKLNMVVLKGVNDHEIGEMIEFARGQGANLQLIELIPLNKPTYDKYHASLGPVEEKLKTMAVKAAERKMQNRMQYHIDGVVVEVVRPGRRFCEGCNKIRLTSDGKLKPCLMRDDNLVEVNNGKNVQDLFNEAMGRRQPYYPGDS